MHFGIYLKATKQSENESSASGKLQIELKIVQRKDLLSEVNLRKRRPI